LGGKILLGRDDEGLGRHLNGRIARTLNKSGWGCALAHYRAAHASFDKMEPRTASPSAAPSKINSRF
jgi:hypothetical protein